MQTIMTLEDVTTVAQLTDFLSGTQAVAFRYLRMRLFSIRVSGVIRAAMTVRFKPAELVNPKPARTDIA